MNSELNVYQRVWFQRVFEPFVRDNSEKNISYPFYLGVSEKYINSKRRIMIVGQETRGFTSFKPDWSIEETQRWAIDYVDYQLHYSNDQELKDKFKRRNSSTFWSFFKLFSKADIVPSWNNIDKAQRYVGGETMSLTEDIERKLNCILPDSNKTLFQIEVEITKPNAVVFITGPRYTVTMEAAMNLKEGILEEAGLSLQNGCVDITEISGFGLPVFWTYHPRYISNSRNPLNCNEIFEKIIGQIA